MKMKLTLWLLLLIWGMAGCTKENLVGQQQACMEQAIHQAELLLEDKPNDAIAALETIADVGSLDDALLVRWCLVYGEAANELRKNELLSLPLFARAFGYCNEHGTLAQKARMAFFLGNAQLEYKEGMKATELYLDALRLASSEDDYKLAGDICFALGELYLIKEMDVRAQEKYIAAAEYYQKANKLYEQVRSLDYVAYTLIYRDSLQNALVYASRAAVLASTGKNTAALGHAANALARTYMGLGEYALAENHALKGIEFDTMNPAPHYVSLSEIYIQQKKFDQARESLRKAETAKSLNKHTPLTIARLRFQMEEAEGNTLAAQTHHKRYIFLRDSLSIPAKDYQLLEVEKNMKELKAQMAIDQKEAKAKNMALWLVLIGAVLLVVAVTCYFLYHPYFRRFMVNRAIMRELYALDIKKEIIDDQNKLLERECQQKARKILFGSFDDDDNE